MTKTVWGLGVLLDLMENMVSQYIQALVDVNLQQFSQLLCDKNRWAYPIAFDAATNHGNSYIDVRVSLCVSGKVHNLHVLAISFHDSHNGEAMFSVIQYMLQALIGDNWCKRLISAATDGAASMVGKYQGAVTRFRSGASGGFYRIWFAAHQLDIVIQDVVSCPLWDLFYAILIRILEFLRQQTNLKNAMRTICPLVASTRWLLLGIVLSWLSKHKCTVPQYIRTITTSPVAFSRRRWWVLLSGVSTFMQCVDVCFQSMQGKDTLFCEQNDHLVTLVEDVRMI